MVAEDAAEVSTVGDAMAEAAKVEVGRAGGVKAAVAGAVVAVAVVATVSAG